MSIASTNILPGNARQFSLPAAIVMLFLIFNMQSARASQAYGSVNNFDVVNDNGVECHGFEIELDDCRSTDITYTYDYNHYGTPKISEVASGGHTNVFIRYQAVWTNTAWSGYTAVPATNIPPTQGHQFTNPRINFGGGLATGRKLGTTP